MQKHQFIVNEISNSTMIIIVVVVVIIIIINFNIMTYKF